ncbi:MAG: hypothetical protein Terrestrivirus9_19 [Terrestrivirus sp.]|uniref:Uncharacterized protein n=1 Tax=Terrestrivirus sp. TaxID=2487775 RepID=A0A3G4ZNW1_9VIRU|nr:MAG: hypothetical protein Terrestrivirus9_19 [Terrestrivirus sp.]
MNDGTLKTVYNIFSKYKTDVFFNITNLNNLDDSNNLDNLNNINNLNNNITNFDFDNIDDSDMDNFNKIKLMTKLKYYEEKEKHYGFISSMIQSKHIVQSIQTEPLIESTEIEPLIESTEIEPLIEPTEIEPLIEPTQIEPLIEPTEVEPVVGLTQTELTVEPIQTKLIDSVQIEQNVQSAHIETSKIHEIKDIVKINEADRQKLLIHNIMMVGNIKPYEKFWLENDTLTLDTNYFQRYIRWRHSQKRDIIIDFIEQIVRECMKILEKNNNENVNNIIRNSILVSCVDIVIIDSVDEIQEQSVLVVNGLKNMRITYPDKKEKIDKIIELLETNKIDLLTSRFM